MTLKRALMVLLLTALAALAGCGDNRGRRDLHAAVDPGLGPITYVVTGITVGGKPYDLVKDTRLRIRFADEKVTLTAGCNTMSGAYSLEESRLTVESLATTEMGCDRPRMDQDTWLAGLFAKPVQLTTGNEPTIVSGSTVLAMTDRKTAEPDRPLIGTTWNLDTIADGDAASSVPQYGGGSIEFNKYGGYRTAVSCGTSQGGKVTVAGHRLSFTDNMNGIADCVPPEGVDSDEFYAGPQAVERIFGQVLVDGATFSIDGNRLTITFGDHSAGFVAHD